ncbi:hypothetical protein IFM47457_10964 [Aspergillus lentulus]|uniref:Uncharacterized protein n=1 Tax=Aspergillus lentulus TaxID=293939 RepID=A0ABQ0ZUU4_ASPLE|nr:hypothetical protein IFM60648_01428 [Aspergillus lentulus]GFF79548.1 hypothetical protein IFM62136_10092 [Aspergillus lentulus]GFF96605.1 hypothetical protein IFM47457_10964 [Aspergillus lentulus]
MSHLYTSGIGLNMTSYLQWSGPPSGYNLPTNYTFNRLDAMVFGTNPWQSSLRWWRHCKLRRFIYVWKPNFLNITVIKDSSYPDALVISSVVTEQNGEPLHTLILPGTLGTPFVLECAYGGNQFQASISLTDRVPPFQVNKIVDHGPQLTAKAKWQLSNVTHNYIYDGHGDPGGMLKASLLLDITMAVNS